MDPTALPANTSSLLPESTLNALTAALGLSVVVTIVFLALMSAVYIISAVRRWKVDNAILAMQKDVADIKRRLDSQPQPTLDSQPQDRQA